MQIYRELQASDSRRLVQMSPTTRCLQKDDRELNFAGGDADDTNGGTVL